MERRAVHQSRVLIRRIKTNQGSNETLAWTAAYTGQIGTSFIKERKGIQEHEPGCAEH